MNFDEERKVELIEEYWVSDGGECGDCIYFEHHDGDYIDQPDSVCRVLDSGLSPGKCPLIGKLCQREKERIEYERELNEEDIG